MKKRLRLAALILQFPRKAVASALVALSSKERLAGFQIVDSVDEGSQSAVDNLEMALELIAVNLPGVFARMRGDIRRIILLKSGGPEYWPFTDAIVLPKGVVSRADIDLLALTLVHEATHARLWKLGIPYAGHLRERLERICVGVELRLAQRLPEPDVLSEFALRKLETPWWTELRIAERRLRALRDLGVPGWCLRLYGLILFRERRKSAHSKVYLGRDSAQNRP